MSATAQPPATIAEVQPTPTSQPQAMTANELQRLLSDNILWQTDEMGGGESEEHGCELSEEGENGQR